MVLPSMGNSCGIYVSMYIFTFVDIDKLKQVNDYRLSNKQIYNSAKLHDPPSKKKKKTKK